MHYNLLPSPYLLELNNLLKNVVAIRDAGKRRSEFNKYSKTFTALPHFWYNWLMYERKDKNIVEEDVKFIKKLRKIALSNFFNEEFLTEMFIEQDGTIIDRYPDNDRAYQKVFSLPYFREDCYKNVGNRKKYLELLGSYLTFPHRHIEAVFDLYKEYSDTFIPIEVKKLYEKNLSFYKRLNKAKEENNVGEWIRLLLDTQDEDIIIQNMEYFIGKRPQSKSAWKLYIFYLYMNDKEEILGVYSRYCRLFVTDEEMINKYFKEILDQQRNGKSCIKYVIDLLDLIAFNESYKNRLLINIKRVHAFNELVHKLSMYDKSLTILSYLSYSNVWFVRNDLRFLQTFNFVKNGEPSKLKTVCFRGTSKQCNLKWNDSNLKRQNFPFCSTIIRYISNNIFRRQKLYQTCKYFFAMNEIPICYGLRIKESSGNGIEYFGSVIEISKDFFNQQITTPNPLIAFAEFLQNTIIASNLDICNSTNRNCFTHLWSLKNNDIEIRYLTLSFQDLTLNEIILINQKCKLISVKFTKVYIFESECNGSFCAIEDVITCFSTLKYLELNCETLVYTEATATKLTNLPENTKFSRFAIFWVTNVFDLNDFCIFLERFTAPNCHICVDYHPNFKPLFQENFLKTIAYYVSQNPGLHTLVIADH